MTRAVKAVIGMAVVAALAVAMCGCTAEWPLKWKASEAQKQAADLAVKDLDMLAAHVDPPGEPVRREAVDAARTAQTYVGPPKVALTPVQPANKAVLDQAARDAARPAPTGPQTLAEGASELERQLNPWLILAASVASAWGAREIGAKILSTKAKMSEVTATLRETVSAIDDAKAKLTPEAVAALSAELAKAQSSQSKVAVTAMRVA